MPSLSTNTNNTRKIGTYHYVLQSFTSFDDRDDKTGQWKFMTQNILSNTMIFSALYSIQYIASILYFNEFDLYRQTHYFLYRDYYYYILCLTFSFYCLITVKIDIKSTIIKSKYCHCNKFLILCIVIHLIINTILLYFVIEYNNFGNYDKGIMNGIISSIESFINSFCDNSCIECDNFENFANYYFHIICVSILPLIHAITLLIDEITVNQIEFLQMLGSKFQSGF